ncbi:hypothetical protein BpHYR1_026104 [Brachionus plicatilis]|uniref:Uncharacterized protein n=1 Tax=Brachionus plicatilis TaxID=10195 RepID=A0A3M7T7N2_BRAPC|nr:hypothetical protein BpHYR1_026104 [Brachionus plicatilis]
MSRINKHKIQEPMTCGADYMQSGPQSASLASSPGSGSSSAATSPAAPSATSNQNFQRRVQNVFSPRDRLEAFEAPDFDNLKPLLMFNLESIQTYRADCKYKRARR